jgi:5-oxoprolinase (ATP-hydrolysing)
MIVKPLPVWLDMGGTFTDCLVHVDSNTLLRGKTLSSGRVYVQATIAAHDDPSSARSSSPASLPWGSLKIEGPADWPADFWVGARVHDLDDRDSAIDSRLVIAHRANQLQTDRGWSLPVGTLVRLAIDSGLESPPLAVHQLLRIPIQRPLPPLDVRLGTTRGTNALLTRRGAPTALLITRGFGDLLQIGQQDRPELFELAIRKPSQVVRETVEVHERVAADGTILQPIETEHAIKQLQRLHEEGIRSIAICLLHGYRYPQHEDQLRRLAHQAGFVDVCCSHEVAGLIHLHSRAQTTVLDAYLRPVLHDALAKLQEQLGSTIRVMTSGGDLVSVDRLRGAESVLSGPAGGAIALQAIAKAHQLNEVIGLDMGGTSTDVVCITGELPRIYATRKAGVPLLIPSVDIETVAAGGGSICSIQHDRLCVGPASAGAQPGPACYGQGGPLTVTDVNLLLDRLPEAFFPFTLDRNAAEARLAQCHAQWLANGNAMIAPRELAKGFWKIAVAHMAEAVRSVTIARGLDPRPMTLVGFGGAAGLHLCAIANQLGIRQIIDHPDASVLSALGMGLATIGCTSVRGAYEPLRNRSWDQWQSIASQLADDATAQLDRQLGSPSSRSADAVENVSVELRYHSSEATIELPIEDSIDAMERSFADAHRKRFGYTRGHPVEVVAIRASARGGASLQWKPIESHRQSQTMRLTRESIVRRTDLAEGDRIVGPCTIVATHHSTVIDDRWQAIVLADGSLKIEHALKAAEEPSVGSNGVQAATSNEIDPVLVELLVRRWEAIATQMGLVLQQTAASVNVRERRDYSCAIFEPNGRLVASAPHVPVHLGAMGHTVRAMMQRFTDWKPGDCVASNDPFRGGSHLPDITVVMPVFVDGDSKPAFFVANRAHHAEIGGTTPGSMPPDASTLEEEGVLLEAAPLVLDGVDQWDLVRHHLTSARYPSRNPDENIADLVAQQAACKRGTDALQSLAAQYGVATLHRAMQRVQVLAASAVRRWIDTLPMTPMAFVDHLDDGTPIAVRLQREADRLVVDFQGSGAVHPRNFNANPAIVTAALLYVMRTQIAQPLPLCEGALEPVDLRVPEGILAPSTDRRPRPAVAAGNVETSQRVVDVLLGALGVCGASQGTMNNLLLGDATFGYYETIGGGSGATRDCAGASAVQTHMTNTRITDPEILESRYPIRLWQFAIRIGSGGKGKHQGGDGVIRELEFLQPMSVAIVSGRRGPYVPYGIDGGEPGALGQNTRIDAHGIATRLPACCHYTATPTERLRIETPGAGAS